MSGGDARRAAGCCAGVWLAAAVLVQVFSYPLWFQEPFAVTAFEFDYFAGLTGEGTGYGVGRGLMAALFCIWGLAHVRLVAWMNRGAWTTRQAGWLVGCGLLVCLGGLPLLSPDVFYYLAKGWIESGYGLDAYSVAIREVPGHEGDPLFANVYRGFQNHAGNYGPAFQLLCALVTAATGGDAALSVLAFKLVALLAFSVCVWLVCKHAPDHCRGVRVFLFAGHPLLLYTFVTASHNDVIMAAAMLAAWAALTRKRWVVAGLLLGFAFSIKWASLMVTPLFLVHALGRPFSARGWKACAAMGLAGLAAALAFHLHYPQSLEVLGRFVSKGYQVVRGSPAGVVLAMVQGVGGEDAARVVLWVLRTLFAAGWGWIAWRLWRVGGGTAPQLAMAAALAFLLYFLLAAQVLMEWYLIWAMVFAAVQPDARVDRWFAWLAVVVMPWAIFQVGSGFWGIVLSNIGFGLSFAIPTAWLMARWLESGRWLGWPGAGKARSVAG